MFENTLSAIAEDGRTNTTGQSHRSRRALTESQVGLISATLDGTNSWTALNTYTLSVHLPSNFAKK